MRGKVQDSPGNAPDSGLSSREWFARFDLDSSSWRTSQLSLLGGLMPFSGRWPRSGTMRNGRAFRLPPLVPRISGTGYSFWPTVNAADAKRGADARDRIGSGGPNLAHAVRMAIPTPTAADASGSRDRTANNGQGSTGHTGTTLCDFVTLYPTPSATDWKGSSREGQRRGQLSEAVAIGGQLNPTWVEWLMGFPPGWTEV